MGFEPMPKKGIMNIDGAFDFIASQIELAFKSKKGVNLEYCASSKFKPGVSVFIVEIYGDAPKSYCPSIYIYGDGTIMCHSVDDSVS